MKKIISVLLIFSFLLLSSCAVSEDTSEKKKNDKNNKIEQTDVSDYASDSDQKDSEGESESSDNEEPESSVTVEDLVPSSVLTKLNDCYTLENSLENDLNKLNVVNRTIFERKVLLDKLVDNSFRKLDLLSSIVANISTAYNDAIKAEDYSLCEQIDHLENVYAPMHSDASSKHDKYVSQSVAIFENIYEDEDLMSQFTLSCMVFDKLISEVVEQYKNKTQENVPSYDTPSSKPPASSLEFLWPVNSGYISSHFGFRVFNGKQDYHSATDIACATGTPVLASASGTVLKSGYDSSYGYYVLLYHGIDESGNGIATFYGHLATLLTETGNAISSGDIIGMVGNSGMSLGSHLHFAYMINGDRVDAENYVPR